MSQNKTMQVNQLKQQISTSHKRVSQLNETEKKSIIYQSLTKEGFTQYEVSKLVNCDPAHINRIAKKESAGLIAPLANLAKRRVKDVLKGEAIGNTEKAKTSDVLKACEMVLDRADPKVNRSEVKSFSAHIEITNEDRDRLIVSLGLINNVQIEGNKQNVIGLPVDNLDKSLIVKE